MPDQKMLESTPFRIRFRDDSGWVAGLHFGARNLLFYVLWFPQRIFLRKSREMNVKHEARRHRMDFTP